MLTRLRELDLMDQTIITITSDHGEEFLEHGGTTHKGQLYEEMLRVPLIVHVPGQRPLVVDDIVRNFDIMPTLLELAGIDHDSNALDAASLRPLLEGKQEETGRRVYANFPRVRIYRDSRYKILEHSTGRQEIYDLLNDPSETSPLVGKSAILPQLVALQAEFMATVETLRAAPPKFKPALDDGAEPSDNPLKSRRSDLEGVDKETLRQLRELGYAE